MIRFVASPLLSSFNDTITHAFSTREGGINGSANADLCVGHNKADAATNDDANKQLLAQDLSLAEEQIFSVTQVHGNDILAIAAGDANTNDLAGGSYDGIITNRQKIAVCVKTADCVPILIFAPKQNVIGAIHAGWRSTALNIAGKAIDVAACQFGCNREEILVAIGPAIGACCYEVDDLVLEALAQGYKELSSGGEIEDYLQACFTPSPQIGRWFLDLKAANRWQLSRAGVLACNVDTIERCTSCEADSFFSHRRDREKGRMLNLIMLR
ncbi:MAG: peptidoglycan editing factor PgeF [Deltaproteobacteria bacterium]|nr:peptidoglycan editing factor PgeF [Deltaproteobacteria bacterium]